MYFVLASTSGGGVGSKRPRSENAGTYCLLVGFTGLFGSIARSRALMFGGALDFEAPAAPGDGRGVGRISIGRWGARAVFSALPALGPGDGPPLGPGLGADPAVLATAVVLVGLGFGTPLRGAGAVEARVAGAGFALGMAVARAMAAVVGEAFGTGGAGVAGRCVARATGAGGFGDGCADGALVGAGDGTAVGGTLTATAIGPTVGTLTGAAGISLRGCVSKTFCVGWGFGCGDCCGIGRGFGGAVGAILASSWRLTGIRCACGCTSGACCTGAIVRTCGTGATARVAAG